LQIWIITCREALFQFPVSLICASDTGNLWFKWASSIATQTVRALSSDQFTFLKKSNEKNFFRFVVIGSFYKGLFELPNVVIVSSESGIALLLVLKLVLHQAHTSSSSADHTNTFVGGNCVPKLFGNPYQLNQEVLMWTKVRRTNQPGIKRTNLFYIKHTL
jgi:hypothetical protein